MPKTYERSIRYRTTKEVDGYVFHLHCVQLAPNEGAIIEEVFIGGSTHNAVDFLDPKLVLMWERELDTEMPEIRAEIRAEILEAAREAIREESAAVGVLT